LVALSPPRKNISPSAPKKLVTESRDVKRSGAELLSSVASQTGDDGAPSRLTNTTRLPSAETL